MDSDPGSTISARPSDITALSFCSLDCKMRMILPTSETHSS